MPEHVGSRVLEFLGAKGRAPEDARLFVVGFAFKGEPETSDIRDSSTLELVRRLAGLGVSAVAGYDPVVAPEILGMVEGVRAVSLEEGFLGADCVLIMNNHRSYLHWNIYDLLGTVSKPCLFYDGWRMFEGSDIEKADGVLYGGIGVNLASRLYEMVGGAEPSAALSSPSA
jgi:UDP-N-acetyl-D-mannosaminuronic acid dehydrogenase